MNLEQRVAQLEDEVQLLKAQIQQTLLAIQEQVLNGTYPTLRVEEPSASVAPTIDAEPARVTNSAPFKKITIPADDLDDDDDLELPKVAEVRNARTVVQAEEPPPASRSSAIERKEPTSNGTMAIERKTLVAPGQELNGRDWIELENWVSQKVEKLGIKRTRELINLYARQEQFTRQERALLLQFVDIYDESSEESPATRLPTVNGEPVSSRPTIVPQTRAVVEELRAELRQKRSNSKKARALTEQELSQRQELVMRLIAGILSAGDDEDLPHTNGNGNSNHHWDY